MSVLNWEYFFGFRSPLILTESLASLWIENRIKSNPDSLNLDRKYPAVQPRIIDIWYYVLEDSNLHDNQELPKRNTLRTYNKRLPKFIFVSRIMTLFLPYKPALFVWFVRVGN